MLSKSKSKFRYDRWSVGLGVEPRLGLMTRCYVLLDSYGYVSLAPSLTRGRVCHLSLSLSVYCQSSIDGIYNY
jgi:hypothetical protein